MTIRYEEDHRQHSTRPTRTTVDSAHAKRTRGEDPAPSPHHEFNGVPANYREINGWGADLDPKNRPSFPMEYPSDVKTARGPVKHWQQPHTKIHQSNEHPGLTPVFGEAVPPHGLSGLLRDYAYQYGEGTTRHWMTLMLADRVDIVESMVVDAFRGRPDNYVKEKAWSAKIKYADAEQRRRYLYYGAAALGAIAVGITLSRVFADHED
ncbi:MAG: hypothetical protein JO197_08100 [Acidobacteria bacterium]|nr:hypothetical protein [Acidobacteriota bacterium]MBV9475945.1 hypothetical protein [Acidobacteriota bacterium]